MNLKKCFFIFTSVFLMILLSAPMIQLPNTSAAYPPFQSFAFINVAPHPAGLGQTVTVGMWLAQPPPTANGPYGDRWVNFKLTITKPDGTTETLGPFTSDDTGGTYTTYTPDQLGNYTFLFTYPGQTLSGNNLNPTATAFTKAYIGTYFGPANATVTLTVQQDPIPSLPQTPLPTEYWQTPVNAENVNQWYNLAGNWLGFGQIFSANTGNYNATANYNPYTTAPKTAHIIWTKPVAPGGALGGEFGGDLNANYYSTSQYEPKFAPVIINGVLYYTQYPGSAINPTGTVAVDLYTGKTLWTLTDPLTLPATTISLGNGTIIPVATVNSKGAPTVLRCGQILDYVSPNQYGGLTYLWTTGTPAVVANATNVQAGSTTYNMFDAMTGTYILSIVNGTAMTSLMEDAGGNLIGYYVNATNANAPTLNMWNSSLCIPIPGAGWRWQPGQGVILNFANGIVWSKPIATNISGVPLPQTLALGSMGAFTYGSINSGVVLLTCITPGQNFFNTGFQIEAAYDANTGNQLWIVNRTQTPATRVDVIAISNGLYMEVNQATYAVVGYSATTGAQLWTQQLTNVNPYDSIGGFQNVVANGICYLWGFGGDVWAIDMKNGDILWQTNTEKLHGDAGTDTPYGTWPLWTFGLGTVADGILFVPEGHEYSPPLFHGAQQLAINITNGELVWKMLAFDVTNPPAITDGIAVTLNAYDNQIYAFAKGPSKLTVTTPSIGVTIATPITISGTITDISAGSQQDAVAKKFPNGLPCVSDASMSPWMEYVYEQQVKPTNTTGVPIVLNVLDSNGNYRTIGTTTSDALGTYSFTWTPDIVGDFSVYATFAGSESYYPSTAAAAFHASEPAATASPVATPVSSMADLYFLPMSIAIIIAIIVATVVIVLSLRKRA